MSDNYTPKQVERRISESTLVKVQAISGLMVGSYLTMHFFTIVAANFGPESFNFYLNGMKRRGGGERDEKSERSERQKSE